MAEAKYPPETRLINLILCDTVLDDKRTGKKSLIGLYDQINATGFPTARDMTVIVSLIGLKEGARVALSMTNPEDIDVLGIEMQPPAGPGKVHELILELQGVPFELTGLYWLVVKVDGRELGRRPVNVVKVDLPPQTVGQA